MNRAPRMLLELLLTIPSVLAIASGARAADGDTLWDFDGEEVGSGFLHQVASDEGGGAFIAWEGAGILVQLLDENGTPQWASPGVQVSSTGSLPAIVAESPWGATVAWEETTGIYVQRINYSGVVQWTSGGVQVATSGERPVLVHIPGVNFGDPPGALIAWGELARVAAINGFGTVTAPGVDGISLGAGVSGVSSPGNMRMISDDAGGAIVAWSDYNLNIVAQRVNAGLPWGTTPTLVSGDFRNEDRLDVAPDGAGGALISWSAIWFLPLEGQVRVQRIDSTGKSLWTANGVVVVDSDVVGGRTDAWTSFELNSSVDTDGNGGAILAWNDWRNELTIPPAPVSGNDDVFAQRVDSTGSILWTANGILLPPFIVGSTAPGSQRFPETVSDGNGGAVVTYQDLGGNSWDISANHLDSLGNKLFSIYVFDDFMGVDERQREPRIVFDGSGPSPVGAVIVWDDERSGLDIRAQKVEISGPANDDSGSAASVTVGSVSGTVLGASQDGLASCGEGGDTDVWYVFTPPGAGTVEVDTCGSHDTGGVDAGIDTVVSLHSGAPGTTVNEFACNDDWTTGTPPNQCTGTDSGLPRDSATSTAVTTTDPVWIRVANFPGTAPNDFVLNVRFVPEPGKWLLLASGLGALSLLRRSSRYRP